MQVIFIKNHFAYFSFSAACKPASGEGRENVLFSGKPPPLFNYCHNRLLARRLLLDNVRYFSHIEKVEVARQVG
jgi:hypothetical protein